MVDEHGHHAAALVRHPREGDHSIPGPREREPVDGLVARAVLPDVEEDGSDAGVEQFPASGIVEERSVGREVHLQSGGGRPACVLDDPWVQEGFAHATENDGEPAVREQTLHHIPVLDRSLKCAAERLIRHEPLVRRLLARTEAARGVAAVGELDVDGDVEPTPPAGHPRTLPPAGALDLWCALHRLARTWPLTVCCVRERLAWGTCGRDDR
jgi:hypothetical protein